MIVNKKAAPYKGGDSSNNVLLGGVDVSKNITGIDCFKSITIHPSDLKAKFKRLIDDNKLIVDTKRRRVLAWLVSSTRAGAKVTRFDAEWVNDHCFNTTVSEIQKLDFILVEREQTKRKCKFGLTDCKQYWLSPYSLYLAEKLLGVSA